MFALGNCRMLANMAETDRRADPPPLNWSDLGVNELPTGTVTLLLADVEGSTRLWQSQPAEMSAAIARLDRALSDLLAAHRGVRPVEQGEGDSFVVAFARASDAVAFALQLQLTPLSPIKLRVGLHTGEVQLRDEANYIGPTINRTARLRDLAHGGQTVLSATTSDLLADGLPDGAWMLDLGAHPLRDLPRPERVAQLCHADLHNDFPPLRAPKNGATQHLPPQFTNFVGRDAEIEEVLRIVGANRLVTLTGAGGVGKTRLAVQVAARLDGDFADGVWYVDLAPITDPDVVPLAVTRALGLPDQAGRTTMDTLTRVIAGRHVLVVLDNCEHLIDACAALATALLAACPAVTIFATSREPIRVPGEVAWPVPSLSLADEAITLFTDRARHVRPDFVVNEANSATVTEICRRLDGIPLAIELAAARVRALSLAQILESLHNRFRLLTGGARTAVRRQQTLRASVDWSHALLTEPERVLFRRAAVFMGGFDLDAAQAVCGDSDVERFQTLDLLTLLIEKSLVVAEDGHFGTRYRMLETVRQYALEKLGESGEADPVRARHRDHYAAAGGPARLPRPHRLSAPGRTRPIIEMDNLRAAFTWCHESSDTATITACVSRLRCSRCGSPVAASQEGTAWFDSRARPRRHGAPRGSAARRSRPRAGRQGACSTPRKSSTTTWRRPWRPLRSPENSTTRRCWSGRSPVAAAIAAFDAEAARPYFDEALGLARALGDDWSLSQILGFRRSRRSPDKATGRRRARPGKKDAMLPMRSVTATTRECAAGVWLWCSGGKAMSPAPSRNSASSLRSPKQRTTRCWRLASLVSLGHLLAYGGDAAGARAAATAAVDGAADFGEFAKGFACAALAAATLAAGDVEASASAAEKAWQLMSVQPELAIVNVIPLAQVALARGDLTAGAALGRRCRLGGPRRASDDGAGDARAGCARAERSETRPNATPTTR